MHDYNHYRPHDALHRKTPMMMKYGKLPNEHIPAKSLNVPTSFVEITVL
jgi:hypothetical protein